MTIDRGTAEGQWQTWLQRLPWDGWIDEPGALQIWGYASRPSYRPGDTVELCVSTTADSWGFEVWRDGDCVAALYEAARGAVRVLAFVVVVVVVVALV